MKGVEELSKFIEIFPLVKIRVRGAELPLHVASPQADLRR